MSLLKNNANSIKLSYNTLKPFFFLKTGTNNVCASFSEFLGDRLLRPKNKEKKKKQKPPEKPKNMLDVVW